MTADAHRHHPAAEKTPKISATGALASPNMADRYGRSPKPRRTVPTRLWVALAVVVTLLAGAFVFWVQTDAAARPSARDTGFTLVSHDEVSGEFELSKNPHDTAICSVKALNSSRVPVGWAEVEIPPNTAEQGNERVSRHSVSLFFNDTATTETVDSCHKK